MGDDGTPRTLLHGTFVQGKASLVRTVSHDDAHSENLVEHILVLRVAHTVTPVEPVPTPVTDAAATVAFQLRTFELSESAMPRALFCLAARCDLHLQAGDVNRATFDPAHPMFVTQEVWAACRIDAPWLVESWCRRGSHRPNGHMERDRFCQAAPLSVRALPRHH